MLSVFYLEHDNIVYTLQLALHVLSFLEPKDLLIAAQTCRTWQNLCEDSL